MGYKEKYEQGLECIQEILSGAGGSIKTSILRKRLRPFFPELAESEEEEIRRWIIDDIRYNMNNEPLNNSAYKKRAEKAIAWLERQSNENYNPYKATVESISAMVKKYASSGSDLKDFYDNVKVKCKDAAEYDKTFHEEQGEVDEDLMAKKFLINKGYPIDANGAFPTYEELYNIIREGLEKQYEQKPANKVEPKFKVDDWITDGYRTWKVVEVQKLNYILQSQDGHTIDASVDRYFRLWTIKEAKDGDVLAADVIESHRSPFVGICKKQDGKLFDTYCFIGHDGKFYKGETGHVGEYVHPATKEQRDLLFQKMKEEGYEWDVDKKELKKLSNEDEKIRKQRSQCKNESNDVVKCLINGMRFFYDDNQEATWGTDKFSMKVKDILAWLEKQ